MVDEIPPLPSSVLTTILTHLLPPSPLPTELVSKVLLHRLLYLPPHPDDLDALLTPLPSLDRDLQPISSRLRELARAHRLSSIQYSREEDVLARISILPEEAEGGAVEIRFEFESGGDGRGWVYHSALLPTEDTLSWVDQPFNIPPPNLQSTEQQQQNADDPTAAPAGYWAAFDSPASSSSSLPSEDDRGEDAYWAQYSRPETQPVTPGPGANGTSQGLTYDQNKVDKDDPRKVAEAVTRSLNALKAERRRDRDRNGDEDQPMTTARDTLDKLRGKIGNILNAAWNDFRGDALDKEEKALRWLSIGRGVVDTPTFTSNGTNHDYGNIDEEILRAKIQVLSEMYGLLGDDEEEDGFWRLVEGTIRSTGGETNVQDEVERQTTYYE